ncbi:hypothetical protein HELRODRAFT_66726 [Helobdella robusta]|uniref:NFACT RNA-binding domain-containing protein n=1 Tax=Helobdella robusta TaxID=6412 RepID=T1FYP4_HELRO|nr:hypothetical protein HELRODRAFT_66726 [Helobdella robusta]ESN98868.1 hypothetical protein HELRODRAFT_66726 [Helobdella robusta]
MKLKFTTFDIKVLVDELSNKLAGMRVNNVYDVDSKTFLIKLNKTDEKAVLLLESGIRLHCTDFEWPKNIMPSGFAMKMRKHLKGRRLEFVKQLGVDRIVDMQFGSGEAAYHIILEMYDRGNIVLTDFEYNILNIQRPRTDNSQDVKFVVREKYPLQLAKQQQEPVTLEKLQAILSNSKMGDNLKKILNPHTVYGGHIIEHCLLDVGIPPNAKLGHEFHVENGLLSNIIIQKLIYIFKFLNYYSMKGYIITTKEEKTFKKDEDDHVVIYSEFHPVLFNQHKDKSFIEFQTFDQAIDEFFSKLETQKQDRKLLQQENTALKKLEHIKSDHVSRVQGLKEEQMEDMRRARLIQLNLPMVDQAITLIRHALAQQVDWTTLTQMVEEAATDNQVLASIKALKLDVNHITMLLKPPQHMNEDGDVDEDVDMNSYLSNVTEDDLALKPMKIDIDLNWSAYANARRYFDMKRQAALKELKTLDASTKAYKSAEKKTMQTLKEVQKVATIIKSRKTHWFEKFLWFISSENYVVIGGRDQQQNEFIVKKYLKSGDIYVHADLHGASSVIIKNPTGEPVPPVTLNEAGCMALCNSVAWEARVVTSSWWVYHHQVSKTAPTGEYLTTGSFMIRGKKNYLPPSNLIYGFAFLFKVDESCMHLHRNERRVKGQMDESAEGSVVTSEDVELLDENDDDDDDDEDDHHHHLDEDNSTKLDEEKDVNNNKNEEDRGEGDGNDEEDEEEEEDDEEERDDDDKDDNKNETAYDIGYPDTQIKYHFEDELDAHDADKQDRLNSSNVEQKRTAKLSAKQRRCVTIKIMFEFRQEAGEPKQAQPNDAPNNNANKQGPLKRGQKSKLKKMKKKYGDQDEEEREMRMFLLASSKGPNEEKLKKKQKKNTQTANVKKASNKVQASSSSHLTTSEQNEQNTISVPVGQEAGVLKLDGCYPYRCFFHSNQQNPNGQELNLLDSLTGTTHADDILLYCLPVCAPYNAITNYKFKVKLTPGTTKRGKAAKMAIAMFMQDKATSKMEKDLLKSVKDTDLSRNMPGKVKVSATKHLTKHKK